MLWLGLLAALAVALGLAALLGWCGPVDRPRERGLHTAPTPTAGGLAILGATAVGLTLALTHPPLPPGLHGMLAVVLAGPVLLGLIGAVDDVLDIPAGLKLVAQLVVIAALVVLIPPPTHLPLTDTLAIPLPGGLGRLGVGLWMLVVLNAVNFMDGANGLVAGALAIVMAGLGLGLTAGDHSVFGLFWLCGAAAVLGFLPLNFPRARLFQGDAGALFLGGLLAAVWMAATGGRSPSPQTPNLYALPIALTPFLTDVLITLGLRARRRARLFDAHRDHLYQRWLATHGGDHARLARRVWAMVAAYTLPAALVMMGPAQWATLTLVGGVAVAVAGWLWIDRGVRRCG